MDGSYCEEGTILWYWYNKYTEVRMRKSMSGCPAEEAMRVLGGRWRAVLLFYVLEGPKRFSDLRRAVPGISQRMLTLDLRALEAAGLVKRTVYPEVPVRVVYSVTKDGLRLRPVLSELCKWGRQLQARAACAERAEKLA